MDRPTRTLALMLLATACAPTTAPTTTPPNAPVAKPPLVTLSLVAARTHAAPGGRIEIGGRFQIAEGWHIYWVNPGDSGLATTLTLTGPPGATVSPVRFPAPVAFDDSFGYAREVVLFADVTAPPDAGAPLTVRAQASWLACASECIPGESTATLTIPVADGGGAPANESLLAAHRARVPVEGGIAIVQPRTHVHPTNVSLNFAVPGTRRATFYPFEAQPALYRSQVSVGLPGPPQAMVSLTFALPETPPAPNAVVAGVLEVDGPAGPRYHTIQIPWSTPPEAP